MRCNDNNNNSHRNFKTTSASLIRVTRHSGPLPCWQRRGSSAICLFVHAVAHHCWPEGRVPATRLRDMTLHTQQYTTRSGTVWTCLRKHVHTIGWPGLDGWFLSPHECQLNPKAALDMAVNLQRRHRQMPASRFFLSAINNNNNNNGSIAIHMHYSTYTKFSPRKQRVRLFSGETLPRPDPARTHFTGVGSKQDCQAAQCCQAACPAVESRARMEIHSMLLYHTVRASNMNLLKVMMKPTLLLHHHVTAADASQRRRQIVGRVGYLPLVPLALGPIAELMAARPPTPSAPENKAWKRGHPKSTSPQ